MPFLFLPGMKVQAKSKEEFFNDIYVCNLVDSGLIDNQDKDIIKLVSKRGFMTVFQIGQHVPTLKKDKLKKRLSKLSKYSVLKRFGFVFKDGKTSQDFYCIGNTGAFILNHYMRLEFNYNPTYSSTEPYNILQVLQLNQIEVNLIGSERLMQFSVEKRFDIAENVFFKVGAAAMFSGKDGKGEPGIPVLFEVVRCDPDYKERFLSLLRRYKKYYMKESYLKFYEDSPIWMICAESDRHARELYEMIKETAPGLLRKTRFLTDWRIHDDQLAGAVIKFDKDDDGKLIMYLVNAPIFTTTCG